MDPLQDEYYMIDNQLDSRQPIIPFWFWWLFPPPWQPGPPGPGPRPLWQPGPPGPGPRPPWQPGPPGPGPRPPGPPPRPPRW